MDSVSDDVSAGVPAGRVRSLQVPGAALHYEVHGSGPPLLLIPGGNGDAGFYAPLVRHVADRYTVISYDRRGFCRSPLDGPVDDDRRLRTDGDDAARLLERMADRPAFVFGSSSGAIVALDLVTRYADQVAAAVIHEPPAVTLLPDGARYLALFEQVYQQYRSSGMRKALHTFAAEAGGGPPRFGSKEFWRMARLLPRLRRNIRFWFEHELRQYTRYAPDTGTLRAVPTRLVLAGGRDSRDKFPYRPNTVLAKQLGSTVIDFPGGHVGYRTHPAEFAAMLEEILI